MSLQRRLGLGLLAAAVGNLAMAAGGHLAELLDWPIALVLVNFAVALTVLAGVQFGGFADFDVDPRHERLVSILAASLAVGGIGLTATGVLLVVDAWVA